MRSNSSTDRNQIKTSHLSLLSCLVSDSSHANHWACMRACFVSIPISITSISLVRNRFLFEVLEASFELLRTIDCTSWQATTQWGSPSLTFYYFQEMKYSVVNNWDRRLLYRLSMMCAWWSVSIECLYVLVFCVAFTGADVSSTYFLLFLFSMSYFLSVSGWDSQCIGEVFLLIYQVNSIYCSAYFHARADAYRLFECHFVQQKNTEKAYYCTSMVTLCCFCLRLSLNERQGWRSKRMKNLSIPT